VTRRTEPQDRVIVCPDAPLRRALEERLIGRACIVGARASRRELLVLTALPRSTSALHEASRVALVLHRKAPLWAELVPLLKGGDVDVFVFDRVPQDVLEDLVKTGRQCMEE